MKKYTKKPDTVFDFIKAAKKVGKTGYVTIITEKEFPIIFSMNDFPNISHIDRFMDLSVIEFIETGHNLYLNCGEKKEENPLIIQQSGANSTVIPNYGTINLTLARKATVIMSDEIEVTT